MRRPRTCYDTMSVARAKALSVANRLRQVDDSDIVPTTAARHNEHPEQQVGEHHDLGGPRSGRRTRLHDGCWVLEHTQSAAEQRHRRLTLAALGLRVGERAALGELALREHHEGVWARARS